MWSEYRILNLLAETSGLSPEFHDCCIRSCIAYTGKYADLTTCPFCKERRYFDESATPPRPRNQYMQYPSIPRLKSLCSSVDYMNYCDYRAYDSKIRDLSKI